MVEVQDERAQRLKQQRARRLAKRTCGHCDGPADTMLPWGNQQVAICTDCIQKLEAPLAPPPWCAFDEVHPRELRPQTSLEAVVVEARLMPAAETVVEEKKRSLIGRILQGAGALFRGRHGRGTVPAITGESD